MAQAVSRRHSAAEARVRAGFSPCGISGGHFMLVAVLDCCVGDHNNTR
jgi:hypothetical protein